MRQQTRALVMAAGLVLLTACSTRPLAEACYQPPASGTCRDSIERYFFDPRSNRCKAFIWGGCEGQVPFETLKHCQTMCETGYDNADDNADDQGARND